MAHGVGLGDFPVVTLPVLAVLDVGPVPECVEIALLVQLVARSLCVAVDLFVIALAHYRPHVQVVVGFGGVAPQCVVLLLDDCAVGIVAGGLLSVGHHHFIVQYGVGAVGAVVVEPEHQLVAVVSSGGHAVAAGGEEAVLVACLLVGHVAAAVIAPQAERFACIVVCQVSVEPFGAVGSHQAVVVVGVEITVNAVFRGVGPS